MKLRDWNVKNELMGNKLNVGKNFFLNEIEMNGEMLTKEVEKNSNKNGRTNNFEWFFFCEWNFRRKWYNFIAGGNWNNWAELVEMIDGDWIIRFFLLI